MRVHPFGSFSIVQSSKPLGRVAGSALFVLLAACSSSGWVRAPLPAGAARVAGDGAGRPGKSGARARDGARIEHGKDGAKDHATVRLRLENLGSVAAAFAPEATSLVTADLTEFGPPKLMTQGALEIAAGSTGEYERRVPAAGGEGAVRSRSVGRQLPLHDRARDREGDDGDDFPAVGLAVSRARQSARARGRRIRVVRQALRCTRIPSAPRPERARSSSCAGSVESAAWLADSVDGSEDR